MSLETTLSDITVRLRQGKFPNEQAISQGIVLRLLQDSVGTLGIRTLFGQNIERLKGVPISPFAARHASRASRLK
jgi:hypothetical protein